MLSDWKMFPLTCKGCKLCLREKEIMIISCDEGSWISICWALKVLLGSPLDEIDHEVTISS